MTNGNILISDDMPLRKSCWVCHARMLVIGSDFVCPMDGSRMSIDKAKPEGALVSVEDGNALLVQPEKNVDELEDMPPGAQVTQEFDVLNGAETSRGKRRNALSADLVLFV